MTPSLETGIFETNYRSHLVMATNSPGAGFVESKEIPDSIQVLYDKASKADEILARSLSSSNHRPVVTMTVDRHGWEVITEIERLYEVRQMRQQLYNEHA